MKRQELKDLSDYYQSEEDFSDDLAENLDILGFDGFKIVQREVVSMNRQADIVAWTDEDSEASDVLVVENQFGAADYGHWGRLEAYARFHNATIAVLVAESFEDLLVETCKKRNSADSDIAWYLTLARLTSHDEFYFNHLVDAGFGVSLNQSQSGESEFWAPVRRNKRSIFSGQPKRDGNDSYIGKQVRGISVYLLLRETYCSVKLQFRGEDKEERRDQVLELFPESEFPESEYARIYREARKSVSVEFQGIKGGRRDPELWDKARSELVELGTQIYDRLKESDL